MWDSRHIAALGVLCLALALGAPGAVAQGIQDGGQLVAAGDRDLRSGNHRGAVRQYSRAINSEQLSAAEIPKVLARRGEAHRKAGRPGQAIADITGALWLKGLSTAEQARAYLNRSLAYEAAGIGDRARADLARARKLNPKVSADTPIAALSVRRDRSAAAPQLRGSQSAPSSGFVTTVQSNTKPSGTAASAPGVSVETTASQPAGVVTTTLAEAPASPQPQRPASQAATPQLRTSVEPAQAEPSTPPQTAAPAPAPTSTAAAPAAPLPAAPVPPAAPQGWATSVESDRSGTTRQTGKQKKSGRIGRFFSGLWSSSDEEKKQGEGGAAPLASGRETPTDNAQPKAQAKASGQSRYRLQLAAVRSENEAQATWKRLASQHKDLLDGREHMIEKSELGTLGTFYRLQIGPFSDKRESLRLCNSFKRSGVDCFLVTQ